MPDINCDPAIETEPGVRLLLDAYDTAVRAAAPRVCLTPASLPSGETLVLGAGKAAASMAAVVNEQLSGASRGLVVTRYGHGLSPGESSGAIDVLEAAHPLPDSESAAAGARLLELADGIRPGETLLFLASGGGSALAIAPLGAVTLAQKRRANEFLLNSGADIREINCVRRHLSALKGGRLAQRVRPARVVTLAISDVPGDAIGDIASGPTIPDPTTGEEAFEILERFDYPHRAELETVLRDPKYETPKPGDPAFVEDRTQIVASSRTALDAAQKRLEAEGFEVRRLGDHLSEEARLLGGEHAALARALVASGGRTALLSGGETRVVVSNPGGRGGRNLEYLAGLALGLQGEKTIVALAADTDGLDGNVDTAGGIVVPDMASRGAAAGIDLATSLGANDTYGFFQACKLLAETGPTRTNVNDFRLILIDPEQEEAARGQ